MLPFTDASHPFTGAADLAAPEPPTCFMRRILYLISSITAAQRATKSCSVTYIVGRQRTADALRTFRCAHFLTPFSLFGSLDVPVISMQLCLSWDLESISCKIKLVKILKQWLLNKMMEERLQLGGTYFSHFQVLFLSPPQLQKTNFNPRFTAFYYFYWTAYLLYLSQWVFIQVSEPEANTWTNDE